MVQGAIYKTPTTTCFVELLVGAEMVELPTSADVRGALEAIVR